MGQKTTTQPKVFIVLGHARSGTSMISGLLHAMGVNMNPTNNPSAQNPKGSFEDVSFIHLTTQIHNDIKNNGAKPAKDRINIKQKYSQKIASLVAKRNHGNRMWGWKSALTHTSLHLFLQFIQNPFLVVNLRNTLKNAESWQLHKKLNYGEKVSLIHALDIVSAGVRNIIATVKQNPNIPTHFVCYEYVKENPTEEAKKLAAFAGIPFTDKLKKDTAEFIMPGYSTLKMNL